MAQRTTAARRVISSVGHSPSYPGVSFAAHGSTRKLGLMEYHDLNKPEKVLWTAFPSGNSVDVRSGDPSEDDLNAAHKWPTERTVRAKVIAALLLGIQEPQPGQFPTLRLNGARI